MSRARLALAHPRRVAAAAAVPATLLTPLVAGARVTDTPLYLGYAQDILDGRLPYRDVVVEYPPLAFAPMLLARLAGPDEDAYALGFAVVMALLAAVLAGAVVDAAVRLGASPRAALGAGLVAAAAPLLTGTVAGARYDLWPTALVALALAALLRDRPRTAGVLVALGVGAKLWPAVLLPAVVAFAWRRAGRRAAVGVVAAFAGALALVVAGPLLVGADGLRHALEVQAGRPLQLESLGAATLVVGHALADLLGHGGAGLVVVTGSGSQNLEGPGVAAMGTAVSVLQPLAVAVAGGLGVRAVLRDPEPGVALVVAVGAATLALVATGRVLSPQFVLWLVPSTALLAVRPDGRARTAALLVVGAWVATGIEFPWWYWTYARLDPTVAVLVLVRDGLLVAACLVTLGMLRPARARREELRARYAASRSSR